MTSATNAATLASFSLGDTNETQAGFTAIGVAGNAPGSFAGPISGTDGGITLQINGGTNLAGATTKDASGNYNSTTGIVSRDRESPSSDASPFTYSSIYRTFLTANTYLGIQLSGLSATTEYAITFYSYDHLGSRTQTFTNATGTQTNVGSITYTAGYTFDSTTPNDVFSTTVTGTTDASGRLFFTGYGTGNTNQGILNGLTVSSIPEPSSAMLLVVTSLALLRRKR